MMFPPEIRAARRKLTTARKGSEGTVRGYRWLGRGEIGRRAAARLLQKTPVRYWGGAISFSTWIAATSSEPSGSFGAPATKTFLPGVRSSLVPGLVVATMVVGVTRIFFSSSGLPWTLYLTVSIWPSTAATDVCSAPLVMKLFGIRSQLPWKELNGCP